METNKQTKKNEKEAQLHRSWNTLLRDRARIQAQATNNNQGQELGCKVNTTAADFIDYLRPLQFPLRKDGNLPSSQIG